MDSASRALLPARAALGLVCLLGLAFASSGWAYEQSEAVRKRYPDPPLSFATPVFAQGKNNFTSHEEMMAYLTGLVKRHAHVQMRLIGRSQEGRTIPLLLFSSARLATSVDAIRLGRPIVWLQGQQHGDEPAGGEAMLALAHRSRRANCAICSTS